MESKYYPGTTRSKRAIQRKCEKWGARRRQRCAAASTTACNREFPKPLKNKIQKMKNCDKVKKEKRELNKLHYLGTVTRGRRGWRRWERMEEVDERVGIDLAAEKIDRERDPERHAISFFDFALEHGNWNKRFRQQRRS